MLEININSSEFEGRIRSWSHEFQREGERFVKDISKVGLIESVEKTPVDTGTLRRGWQLLPITSRGGSIQGGYGNNVHYMLSVNYGYPAYGRGHWIEGSYMIESGESAMRAVQDRMLSEMMRRVMG